MGLEVLYLLIPVTFVLAAFSLLLFVWAIRSGQFDDLDTPAIRILFEEDEAEDVSPALSDAALPPHGHGAASTKREPKRME